MEKIKLEDGTEREVPTREEIVASAKAVEDLKAINETFGSLKTELGIADGEDPISKLKELKESQNPNWSAMRTKLKAAEKTLKENGMEIDESGNISKSGEKIDVSEIINKAQEAGKKGAEEIFANQVKEEMFGQFTNKDERKSVETVFDRLMQVGGTTKENFELAVSKIFPDRKNDIIATAFYSGTGNAPLRTNNSEVKIQSPMARQIEKDLGLNKDKK